MSHRGKRSRASSPGRSRGSEANPAGARAAGSRRRVSWLSVGVAAVALAALTALVVVAATRSKSNGAASSGSAAVATPSGGGAVGGRVASLKLASIDGQRVSVPKAGRPGALFFAVSSCGSCVPSARALSALNSRLGSRVDVTMVDLDPSDPPKYLQAWGNLVGNPSYPLTIDTTGHAVNAYRIQALGTTVIYDARGQIVDRLIEPDMGQLEAGFSKAGVS